MSRAVATYLSKRSVHHAWSPAHGSATPDALRGAVVIPVLAESDRLFQTLADLAANSAARLRETLVLCVVNNRTPDIAGEADCADNQRTLAQLPDFTADHPDLRLAWIDAASPGRELGAREGVGLARRIGLDYALACLAEAGHPGGPLICLDADTRVEANYLDAIHDFFASHARWAAVLDYAHPVAGDSEETRAILSYELYLRYQELAWHYAGSPYAYPAIGSTMVCTGIAYAAAGGMNRRQAGEDFYFLQQLAKTGVVERIRDTTVSPAGRPSHRVPFGTGRKVGAYARDPDDAYRTYHPDTYRVLRAWLDWAPAHQDAPGEQLLEGARAVDRALADFLDGQGLVAAWNKVRGHCTTTAQRTRQFHQWFDAFRTLMATHHLRDNGYPRQDLFEALGQVIAWHDFPAPVALTPALRDDLDGQRELLTDLRAWRP